MHVKDDKPLIFQFNAAIGGYEYLHNGIRVRLFELKHGWEGQICWMGTHPSCLEPCDDAPTDPKATNTACVRCANVATPETTIYNHETVDGLADLLRSHLSGAMSENYASPCVNTVLALSAWRLVHEV
jgi:hypothetical protein